MLSIHIVNPIVSVVVPSYNRGNVIAQTLDSALAQTYPQIELIVVDDGSTDGTERAVEPYRDRIIYVRQQNQGLAAARNAGMARSTGEFVAWLDSDDLWNAEKVALQVAFMQQHPVCALIASDFSAFDESGYFDRSHMSSCYGAIGRTPGGLAGFFPRHQLFRTTGLPHMGALPELVSIHYGAIYRQLVGGNVLHPPTVLYRREAAQRAGMLDKKFRRDSDWEYLLRLSREGDVAFINHPLMRYRYSPDQMSSDKYSADIAESRLLVLESLKTLDLSLVSDAEFRKRLGYSHLAAASAMADDQRLRGARHLVQSLRYGIADRTTVRTAAKLLLPRRLSSLFRKPVVF